MSSGCALVGRGDRIFSDVYAWEFVRCAVFPAGAKGSGGSGWAILARRVWKSAELAAAEHSSPRAAVFSAGTGEESDRPRVVVGAADGAFDHQSTPALW